MHMGKRFISPGIWFKASHCCPVAKRFYCSLGLMSLYIHWQTFISFFFFTFKSFTDLFILGSMQLKHKAKMVAGLPLLPHNILYILNRLYSQCS